MLIRRQFIGAIVIDIVVVSYIGLVGILHAIGASADNGEMAPFIFHAGHVVVFVFGLLSIRLPSASFAPRAIATVAPLIVMFDAFAVVAHLLDAARHERAWWNECRLFAAISALLTLSSCNVWLRSSRELSTFGGR